MHAYLCAFILIYVSVANRSTPKSLGFDMFKQFLLWHLYPVTFSYETSCSIYYVILLLSIKCMLCNAIAAFYSLSAFEWVYF